jgi:microcystin-dependent protein
MGDTMSSLLLGGLTSGTIELKPADVAGTTVINVPATTGTMITSGDVGTVTKTMLAGDFGLPTGAVIHVAMTTAPSGYLKADGSAVSRTTYATLFAILGTTFGVGDNSTTFNLPNYTNRGPIGAGGLYSMGATGGSKDATVVSHTHTATVTDPGHKHQQYSIVDYSAGGYYGKYQVEGPLTWPDGRTATLNSNMQNAQTLISVQNSTVGSSGTDANMQPYLAIFYIIKT